MKTQEAIGILYRKGISFVRAGKLLNSTLMLSPCYWRVRIPERRQLLKEFLARYGTIVTGQIIPREKRK